MLHKIHVPFFDANTEILQLTEVFAVSGSKVSVGDPFVQFETSKSLMDFESPQDGFVMILYGVGEMLKPGDLFAVIGNQKEEVFNFQIPSLVTSNSFQELSSGVLLELKKSQVSQKHFLSYLQEQNINVSSVNRQNCKDLLKKFAQGDQEIDSKLIRVRPLNSFESTIKKNIQQSFHSIMPLWISAQIEADDLLKAYESYTLKNQLTGNLTELCMWGALELLRQKPFLAHFVHQDYLYEWKTKALSLVVKQEDGNLLIPTLKVTQDPQNPGQVAENFLEIKQKIVTQKLSAQDFEGGGLVLSVLENEFISGFNAIPAPFSSFALAVSGPKKIGTKTYLNLCLTYDHQFVDGQVASKILQKFYKILQDFE